MPNAANRCGPCLARDYDLASVLNRGPASEGGRLVVRQCRRCRKYERTPKDHVALDPESPELTALLLRKVPALTSSGDRAADGVSDVTLVDASWIWTEPHSMRFKLALTVTASVADGLVRVKQRVPAEFFVGFRQCPDCAAEFRHRTWHALVQVRQRTADDVFSRGLRLLEAALARRAHVRRHVLRVVTAARGFDFYFATLSHAQEFVSHVGRATPVRTRHSKKLVSEDRRNNTAHVRHTFSVDMVPLCRDDLVVVSRGARAAGLDGRLALVARVASAVRLVDACPARDADADAVAGELRAENYWRNENGVRTLLSARRLARFVVLDAELCDEDQRRRRRGDGDDDDDDKKYLLADVEVVRESRLGHEDETLRCVTHLGRYLKYGDVVLGYDLTTSVLPNDLTDGGVEPRGGFRSRHVSSSVLNHNFVVPDVVLVRKISGPQRLDDGNGDGNDNDATSSRPETTSKRGKSRSSANKKRERRQKKQHKKEKELRDVGARMGILDTITERDGNDDNADLRAVLEREAELDPEWKDDLDEVERELAKVDLSQAQQQQQRRQQCPESQPREGGDVGGTDETKTNDENNNDEARESDGKEHVEDDQNP